MSRVADVRAAEPATQLLARHLLYDTDDARLVHAMGSSAMSPHRLHASGQAPLSARAHRVELGASSLFYFSYADGIEIEASEPVDYYTLHLTLSGNMRVSTATGESHDIGPGQACVLSPSAGARPMATRWHPGTEKVTVKVPRSVVQRALGVMCGRTVSVPIFEVTDTPTPSWVESVRLALRTIDKRANGAIPAAMGTQLENLIVSTLVLSHQHSLEDLLIEPGLGHSRAAALSAARILGRDPAAEVTVAGLAAEVGVAERTLRNSFQAQFGVGPAAYLRDLRLDRAHEQLAAADPTGDTTVADIAIRTGHGHPGRFAIAYRTRFGVSPSTTLGTRITDDTNPTNTSG